MMGMNIVFIDGNAMHRDFAKGKGDLAALSDEMGYSASFMAKCLERGKMTVASYRLLAFTKGFEYGKYLTNEAIPYKPVEEHHNGFTGCSNGYSVEINVGEKGLSLVIFKHGVRIASSDALYKSRQIDSEDYAFAQALSYAAYQAMQHVRNK